MTDKINFRRRAREHFKAATELMDANHDDALLSAALRMRMSIECLAYELLQTFKEEVDDDAMDTWQPGRLIHELKEIDSSIESDRSLSIEVTIVPGKPAKEMRSLGTDVRLSASWISKSWHALGSHLHEPTIKQHREGKVFEAEKVRRKIATIADEIERVLSATLFATNINLHLTVPCECGFVMKRREALLRRDGKVICANCKTVWDAQETEEKNWRFLKLFHKFPCPTCREMNTFPAKELFEGSESGNPPRK